MNLKRVRSVVDKGDHFYVDHETHGQFKIAKRDLDRITTNKIQALCSGGQVKGYADGGDVYTPPDYGVSPSDLLPQPPAPVSEDQAWRMPPQGAPPQDFNAPALLKEAPTPSAPRALKSWEMAPGPAQDAALKQEAADYAAKQAATAKAGVTPMPEPQTIPGGEAPPPQTQGQPGFILPPPPPGMASLKDLQADADAQKAAVTKQANIEARKAQADREALETSNAAIAASQQAYAAKYKAADAEGDQIRQGIMDSKINPNHYWQSMSTGNKIASTIAMVLSGIGSGLAGGQQNLAMKVIDDNIARDIDAQKAELGKKESLLSFNLKRTADLREAEQMTRSMMLANVQGQLAKNAAQFGGQKALAAASQTNAQLQQSIDVIKHQQAGQAAQQMYAYKMQLAGLAMQQQGYQSQQRFDNGQGNQWDFDHADEKTKEVLVNTSTGYARAFNAGSADKYRDSTARYQSLRGTMNDLISLSKSDSRSWDPEKKAQADTLLESLRLGMGESLGVQKSDDRTLNMVKSTLGDNLTDIFRLPGGGGTTKLETARKLLDDGQREMSNAYLVKKPEPKIVKK